MHQNADEGQTLVASADEWTTNASMEQTEGDTEKKRETDDSRIGAGNDSGNDKKGSIVVDMGNSDRADGFSRRYVCLSLFFIFNLSFCVSLYLCLSLSVSLSISVYVFLSLSPSPSLHPSFDVSINVC